MQTNIGGLLNLFLLTSFATCAASPTSSQPSLFLPRQDGRIRCDTRTKPPTRPSFQDCQGFLWDLSVKSHQEPAGAFKWYGYELGPCDDCVELPTLVIFRNRRCAGLIDSDDKNHQDFSVFDLKELWQALSGVVGVCWLGEKHNGIGYPGSQIAWAGLVENIWMNSEILTKESLVHGNRTLNILDLDGDGTRSAVKSSS